MNIQPARRAVSQGICAFCHAEFAKTTMTRHLKTCKQRRILLDTQETQTNATKTRLFHILAEGRYNPQYWLHFEIAASEPLLSIDAFLKAMWITDLDHLSGFTIGDTTYSNDDPDDFFFFGEMTQEEEEESAADEEQDLQAVIDTALAQFSPGAAFYTTTPLHASPLSEEWVAALKQPRSLDVLVDFLKEERTRIHQAERAAYKDHQDSSPEVKHLTTLTLSYQKLIVEELLDAIEDRSMDVSLARVLTVGQKFSYIYDYGSSTYIQLRVLAEREGIAPNQPTSVHLLARNSPLAFACCICGNPATTVAVGYYTDSIADGVYCTRCAKKHIEEGSTLPLLNSPRAGVL